MKALTLGCVTFLAISTALADDYRVFEEALQEASFEVNKLKVPDLVYRLDEPTARDYFSRYFAANLLTEALRCNLGYPVCHWGNNHENLQRAIGTVFIAQLEAFFSRHQDPKAVNAAITQQPSLHNHLFYMLGFLVDLANSNHLDNGHKADLRQKLLSILDKSRLATRGCSRIDKTKFPYVNSIRTQLLLTCFSLAKSTDALAEFSSHLPLPGERKTLFERGVLVIDNGGFDPRQLAVVKNFVDAIPPHLRTPVAITCFDLLIDPERNKFITVHSFQGGAFNVFGAKVGAWAENQFPKDHKPVECDGFAILLAHEYNHNVDAVCLAASKELLEFRQRLLTNAGSAQGNYCRSMIEAGFFQKNPQEFVASLANQYFCNSKELFELALLKSQKGNYNHINQFILMASLYSDAANTFFYRIGQDGSIATAKYPVKKDGGLITRLSIGKKNCEFSYSNGLIDRITIR